MKYILILLALLLIISPVSAAVNRTLATDNLSKMDETNYWTLVGYFGGNETLNSTDDEINFVGILMSAKEPYIDLLDIVTDGTIFYAIVFGVIFFMIFIRQGSTNIPSILGIIIGGVLLALMPSEYYLPAVAFIVLSIVGILYGVLKER